MTVAATNPYADLGLALKPPAAKPEALGQEAFLTLMTTQLKNQDPFKPMESGEFLGQIAQFSTVSGIQQLNDAFSGLSSSLTANQTLQAAQLVGHTVQVPSEVAPLGSEGSLYGAIDVPSSGQVSVEMIDGSGQVVRRLDMGTLQAGNQQFAWDGLDANGERAPAGTYTMRASLVQGNTRTDLDTSAIAEVRSVALGSAGLTLELFGLPPVALADIQQII